MLFLTKFSKNVYARFLFKLSSRDETFDCELIFRAHIKWKWTPPKILVGGWHFYYWISVKRLFMIGPEIFFPNFFSNSVTSKSFFLKLECVFFSRQCLPIFCLPPQELLWVCSSQIKINWRGKKTLEVNPVGVNFNNKITFNKADLWMQKRMQRNRKSFPCF